MSYSREKNVKQNLRGGCLSENEVADFKVERLGEYPSVDYNKGFVEVIVKDKYNNKEIKKIRVDDINLSYHPAEVHKCGIYVIKRFNYNPKIIEQEVGYREELWKYDYRGSGTLLILLAEKPKEFISYYSPDFRIFPNEKYVVLEKGYLGKEDYSLVVKDLETKEDILVILANNILEKYPKVIGNFGFYEWSDDGRYFWGDIFDGAYVNGYFRIDTQNWKVDIFEAPDGAMGGSDLNINTGYITIQPGQVWTGDYQMDQDLKEQYRKEGKKSLLYIYNLFTKEKILVVETEEPLWWFKSQWISDSELQYEMPNGEKKIYKLNL